MAFDQGNQAGSVQYEQNRTKDWSLGDTADEVDDGRARGRVFETPELYYRTDKQLELL